MKAKIFQLGKIKSGYLFKKRIELDKEGNVRVVQLKDVDESGIIRLDELQRIGLDKIDPENFLNSGDVLFKAKTNHPVAAVVKDPLPNTIATAHYFIISVKKADVLPAYLAWYLNQRPAQVFFEKHAGGTRIQVVNKQVLGEFEVEIPEFSVQEKIVKVYELHQRELFLLNSIKNQRNLMISVQLLNIVSD